MGYPPAIRAQAVTLSGTVGYRAAARTLGLNPRTVNRWLHKAGTSATEQAEQSYSEALQATGPEAIAALRAVLQDPRAPAVAKVRAFEAWNTANNLAEGRATSISHSESMNVNVAVEHKPSPEQRQAIEALFADIERRVTAGDIDGAEKIVYGIRAIERGAERILSSGVTSDPREAIELLKAGTEDV